MIATLRGPDCSVMTGNEYTDELDTRGFLMEAIQVDDTLYPILCDLFRSLKILCSRIVAEN